MALSDLAIKAFIRAAEPVHGVSDGNGLTFRITATGTACWVLRYRFGGRQKSLYLGQYPEISLSKARGLAIQLRGRVMQGEDVAHTKQAERQERASAKTVAELTDDYCTRVLDREYKRPQPWRKLIERDINSVLGKRLIRDITDRDVILCIDKVMARGTPAEANHTLRVLKRIFKYAKSRRYTDTNPAAEIGTDAAGGSERSRERCLSRRELADFLQALPSASINQADKHALWLLMLSMVRVSELVGARWSEVAFDEAEWSIPAERSKNGKGYVIPMAPRAIKEFAALKVLSGYSDWVLPSRRREGLPHINRETLNRAQRTARPESVADFVLHDLRRTGRTHLAALGVPYEVAERCLNHSLRGVEGIYNRHDYLAERRSALTKYADLLASLEAGATAD